MTKEELEKEARTECFMLTVNTVGIDQRDVELAYVMGAEPREKQIAELEQKLEQTEKDLADYQFNYPSIKELQKENADLKEEINKIAFARGNLEEENAELKEENLKWKDEWQEQVQKATDEGYARTLQTIQLTKAKEIIREVVEWATWQGSNCPNFKSIQDKAEQFLNSEVEK